MPVAGLQQRAPAEQLDAGLGPAAGAGDVEGRGEVARGRGDVGARVEEEADYFGGG